MRKISYLVAAIALVSLSATFISCGEDEKEPNPTPVDNPEQEHVFAFDFSIQTSDGSDIGTEPAVVEAGDTLDVVISQASSYTDPDGSVVTYRPNASVRLFAESDTLYAKDLQTLITIKELANDTLEESEGELIRHLAKQEFSVGGQLVTFDMMHEVYRHVNSGQATVEMPYIKVNPAQYGTAQATEESAETRSPAHITGIRLTPLFPQTRSTVLRDTATYEVAVSFNLDLESVHAKNADVKNLPFEVKFVAVVESITELPDPAIDFSYQLKVLGGTRNTVSPFTLINGQTLALQWIQNSRYTYFSIVDRSSHEIAYEPKAEMSLYALKDTVYVDNKDELEQITPSEVEETTDGENPTVHTFKQSYAIGGNQQIEFSWGYDAYGSIEVEGHEIALPYVAFSTPELLGVNITERPDITIPNKEAVVYEVSVRFGQQTVSQNAADSQSQYIEYIVKYMAVQEVRLVKVTYRKGWEWNTPHDNIILGYFARVYRDRTYSDGKTFTDTFGDMGHFVGRVCSTTGGSFNPSVKTELNWEEKNHLFS